MWVSCSGRGGRACIWWTCSCRRGIRTGCGNARGCTTWTGRRCAERGPDMPMITGELKWYTVASTIEQAVYAELTTKPDRHSVVPGAIAWDECDCGLLAVSVARIFLSETFP